MARFHRAFLVPYLQDICALHLAWKKLNHKVHELNSEIRYCQEGEYCCKPEEPSYRSPYTDGRILLIGLGIFFIVMFIAGIILFYDEQTLGKFGLNVVAFFLPGAAILYGVYSNVREHKCKYEKERIEYNKQLEKYKNTLKYNEKIKADIPEIEAARDFYASERSEVEQALNHLYSANILPSRYRNLYVAVYLYDWFSFSQADDLDHALQMFVLEEIKSKLDKIIDNQSDMILNQSLIMANQRKTIEQQNQHYRMMQNKLNQIQASNEERNLYLKMIQRDTAATAFFAQADYIRNL